jgi:hypothetical protein
VLSFQPLSSVVRVFVAGGFILWSAALTSRPTGPNRQLLGFSLQCLDIASPFNCSPALGPVVSIVRAMKFLFGILGFILASGQTATGQSVFYPADSSGYATSAFASPRLFGLDFSLRNNDHAVESGLGALYMKNGGKIEGYAWVGYIELGRIYWSAGPVLSAGAVSGGGLGFQMKGGVFLSPHLFVGVSGQAVAGLKKSYGFAAIQAGVHW